MTLFILTFNVVWGVINLGFFYNDPVNFFVGCSNFAMALALVIFMCVSER